MVPAESVCMGVTTIRTIVKSAAQRMVSLKPPEVRVLVKLLYAKQMLSL